MIDTISHEAGHNLGLSHSSESDSQARQIVTKARRDLELDGRFSTERLNHLLPETDVRYSETGRLIENLGAAAVPSADAVSSQTLPLDPTVGALAFGPSGKASTTGRVDFAGDRDAHRFTVGAAGRYALTQRAASGSALAPAVTLWNARGECVAAGESGSL